MRSLVCGLSVVAIVGSLNGAGATPPYDPSLFAEQLSSTSFSLEYPEANRPQSIAAQLAITATPEMEHPGFLLEQFSERTFALAVAEPTLDLSRATYSVDDELTSSFADTIELLQPVQIVARPVEDESVSSHIERLGALCFAEVRPTDDELVVFASPASLWNLSEIPKRTFLFEGEDELSTGELAELLAAEVTGSTNDTLMQTASALDGFEDR